MNKQRIIDKIIEVEGGYVNDPSDSGGETNFGITIAAARAYGYRGDMRELPRVVAFAIYSARYWEAVEADKIIELSEVIAEEIVDTSVNLGPRQAGRMLQRALNVLNDSERLYPDLKVDGHIGPATLTALGMYVGERSEIILCRALNCLQGVFYIELAERREKDERFLYGWLRNRVTL